MNDENFLLDADLPDSTASKNDGVLTGLHPFRLTFRAHKKINLLFGSACGLNRHIITRLHIKASKFALEAV